MGMEWAGAHDAMAPCTHVHPHACAHAATHMQGSHKNAHDNQHKYCSSTQLTLCDVQARSVWPRRALRGCA